MPLQKIGKMSLKCSGGFVAKIQLVYIDENGQRKTTGKSGNIPLGQTKTVDPASLHVPDGSLVYMRAFVVWGKDNEANQCFQYTKGEPLTAHYNISGTTLNNDLGLTGIS